MAELDRQRGERIRDLRDANAWTQRQLADKLQVDPKTVHNWEAGRELNPTNLRELAEVLDVTTNYIRFGEREAPDLGDLLESRATQSQMDRLEANQETALSDLATIRVELAALSTQLAELQKLLRRRTDTAASKSRNRKVK